MKSESEVAESCPTLSDPMDCSLPGSSVHGIFQARVLEWGATGFSTLKGSGTQMNTNKIILEFRKQGGRWMTLDRQTRVSATPSVYLTSAPDNLWFKPLLRITLKPPAFFFFFFYFLFRCLTFGFSPGHFQTFHQSFNSALNEASGKTQRGPTLQIRASTVSKVHPRKGRISDNSTYVRCLE